MVKKVFLYPCDPLKSNRVDECYKEEYEAAIKKGLIVYLIDIENLSDTKKLLIPKELKILYRGWILSEGAYEQLERMFGDQLITSKQDYLNAHYLPNWYHDIAPLTIPTVISTLENVHQDFKKFSKAFIKDYAKSLKTGLGSIVTDHDDLERAVKDMVHYRGSIEGGIVLREVVDLLPHSEVRFFVMHDKVFSPNSDSKKFELAKLVHKKLKKKNLKFYSIDIATTKEGKDMVIEIGDGQVSDYVGWNLNDFIEILSV